LETIQKFHCLTVTVSVKRSSRRCMFSCLCKGRSRKNEKGARPRRGSGDGSPPVGEAEQFFCIFIVDLNCISLYMTAKKQANSDKKCFI